MKTLILGFLSLLIASSARALAGPERLDVASAHANLKDLAYRDGDKRAGLIPVIGRDDAPQSTGLDPLDVPWRAVSPIDGRNEMLCYHPIFGTKRDSPIISETVRFNIERANMRIPCFYLEITSTNEMFYSPPPADDSYVVRIARRSGWLRIRRAFPGAKFTLSVASSDGEGSIEVKESPLGDTPFVFKDGLHRNRADYVKIVSPEQFARLSSEAATARAKKALGSSAGMAAGW